MRARKKLSLVQWASESSAVLVQLYSTCPLGELKRIERTSVLYRLSRKKRRGIMYFLNVYLSKGQVNMNLVLQLIGKIGPLHSMDIFWKYCRKRLKNSISIVWKYFLWYGNILEILWKYSGNKISILWKRSSSLLQTK